MFIGNFTPDEIRWQHIGVEDVIKPGQIIKVDDSRGNHILNRWGQRGLLRLEFGDTQDQKRDEAMSRYREFWIRHITNFNQENEKRKGMNLAYNFPTGEMRTHAKELGLDIVGPWVPKVPTEGSEGAELENAKLKVELGSVKDQLAKLMEMVAGIQKQSPGVVTEETAEKMVEATKPKVEVEKPTKKLKQAKKEDMNAEFPEASGLVKQISEFTSASKYRSFVIDNFGEMQDWSSDLLTRARYKWTELIPDEDWPLPA